MFDPPVFITVRDRVTPLRQLVDWLERAGHERITLLDNASTYEPLVAYLDETPHRVIRLGENHGSQALWVWNLAPRDEHFVVTDPDIVPTEDCPLDAVAHLHELLERWPGVAKAGLGLYLDDVPASMPSLAWERSLVSPERQLEPGAFYSLIDTTFALHRPGTEFCFEAIRTGAPYEARHVSPSWYGTALDTEDAYYLEHAAAGPLFSSWAQARDQAA